MENLDEILGAFEQALELERELGARTVDCDRALLVPLSASKPAPPVSSPAVAPAAARPAPPAEAPAAARPAARPAATPVLPVRGDRVDFAFIAECQMEGPALQLLEKMVAAMGYAMGDVRVVPVADAVVARPSARVYVVLGSQAFRVFAPGERAALGLSTKVDGVPTIVTYSPARILAYFGNDAEGLLKAKRQIWSDLKSALAQIGKKPPAR